MPILVWIGINVGQIFRKKETRNPILPIVLETKADNYANYLILSIYSQKTNMNFTE